MRGNYFVTILSRRLIWTAVVILVGAYVVGFLVFVSHLPRAPDGEVRADGIVALTGGNSRLFAAAALLEDGAGRRLLISGVHPSITKSDLKRIVRGGARFDCCTDLGFAATSTHGNADEAARWARAHGYRSLVIVTSDYHMPRTLREFSTRMPKVRLVPYPVEEAGVDVDEWWRDPRTLRVLHLEYAKYLASIVIGALGPPQRMRRMQ